MMKKSPTTMGGLIALALGSTFTLIAVAALGHGGLADFDETVAHDMMSYCDGHALARTIMIGFTYIGGTLAMLVLALCGVVWELRRRRFILALAWIILVAGGALLNQGLKISLDRPRPANPDPIITLTNPSFPSGHAMGSMIGFGMLGYIVCLSGFSRCTKVGGLVTLAAVIALIGLSRIFLRAHYLSDVVAGFLMGLAWLSLGLGMLETRRRTRIIAPVREPELAPEMARS